MTRRLVLMVAVIVAIVVSAWALWSLRETETRVITSAQILETKIVVRGEGPAKWHYFEYNLPKAGSATLRLSNGARTNALSANRVEGAEVTLRGKGIVTPKEFNKKVDVLEIPVELQAGINQLGVRLHADSGKRISVRIDVPADEIVLAPIPNAVVVGREPLRARATVTGLGVPIRNAEVRFEVLKLGRTIERKATTSNTGKATAYLSGFGAGAGKLRATLSTGLSDAVPITVVAKRTLSVRQRSESVRLEVGSSRAFGLVINLREVQGDQDFVMLKHVVRSVPGSDPGGVLVRNNIPSQEQVVTAPKSISVSPIVTAVNPGRYTVTTTVTVADKAGAEARESFSTELTVEVVPPGTPDPLRLSPPRISPSGIAPGSKRVVAFRTLITGLSKPPQVLFLDRVSNRGEFITQETELRDDGKEPDAKAGDGFYSGQLELGSEEEAEIYFRLRADDYFRKTVTSGFAVFPITRLPLGSRPSTGTTVDSPGGQSKIFTNEVVVEALAGVSPRRVKTIVAEVGDTLGLKPPDDVLDIVGYIPSLDSYLVEFKVADPPETLQLVDRAISAFSAYAEVEYASPSITGQPAADWWLSNINVDQLRSSLPTSLLATGPEAEEIGVAIIDNGVNCNDSDLSGKCADPSSEDENWAIAGSCETDYNVSTSSASSTHGTKVAALAAGEEGTTNAIQGVDEGVARAWDVKLLPFGTEGLQQHAAAAAMDCAVTAGAHILNVSYEWEVDLNSDSPPLKVLEKAVCKAVCDNRLVVAAAGNKACPPPLGDGYQPRYPASYNGDSVLGDPATTCSCPDPVDPNGRMLKVGGTDSSDAEGDECNLTAGYFKSQLGEIYAPGWGVGSGPSGPHGTSWSAPLVSGCAAILSAVQKSIDKDWWDPNFVEWRLRTTSTGSPPLLNCLAAVTEPKDIVFVLDRSGSMSSTTNIDTTLAANRWGALKMAVGEFAMLIPDYVEPGSRFGLTLFSSRVFPALPTTDPEYDPRFNLNDSDFSALVDINSGLAAKVISELNSQNDHVYGSTAMGAGLQDGVAKLDVLRPRVVVLFTDGEQNVDPLLDIEGCSYLNPTTEHPATEVNFPCPVDPYSDFVRIIPIGIGHPSSYYLTTLQNLASKNGGKFIVTDNGTDFSNECTNTVLDIWDCAVALAFYGNSPQMVASYKDTLPKTVSVPAFDLNKYVSQLLVKLSFSQKFKRPELLSILEGVRIVKDGTDITNYFQPAFPSDETDTVLLKTNFVYQGKHGANTIAPEGSYRVQITAAATSQALGYKVVSYADDHRLGMDWQISPVAPRVNQPFSPTVRLSWRGRPVTTANVEALILMPGEDLGDLLAKHPQKVDPSSAPDKGSPGYQKYLHLLENDPDFLAQLRPKERRLILAHQGDGQYSASYNPDLSGIHQIVYRINAEDREFGKIQRKATQSIYVRFGDIDLDESAVSSTVKGNTVTINFRPTTTYGRFIGPAQGSAFSVDSTAISLNGVIDHQDGSYTLALRGNPDAEVAIKLLGEEIYQGPASKFPKKGLFGKLFDWGEDVGLTGWFILFIIVVLLLLLIWLVWRVIGGTSGP